MCYSFASFYPICRDSPQIIAVGVSSISTNDAPLDLFSVTDLYQRYILCHLHLEKTTILRTPLQVNIPPHPRSPLCWDS